LAIHYLFFPSGCESLEEVLQRWISGKPIPGIPIEDLKFFPKASELRLAASLLAAGSTSEQAWDLVVGYLRNHGPDSKPKRGKPILDKLRPEKIYGFEPDTPAPQIPLAIVKTIDGLGPVT
jgi:hypothetical protein